MVIKWSSFLVTCILQSINLQEDWKLVSIWIGGNDLCAVCEGNVSAYVCACEEVGGGGSSSPFGLEEMISVQSARGM